MANRKLRRMTAPAGNMQKKMMADQSGGVRIVGDQDENNPFSFQTFVKRSTVVNDEEAEEASSGSSDRDDDASPPPKSGSPANPFSFKKFVKKDKRRAVYYDSKEKLDNNDDDPDNHMVVDMEMDFGGDMGNQNGTVPDGRDPNQPGGRPGGGGGGHGHGHHGPPHGQGGHPNMGSPHHGGGGGGATQHADKTQRRATSSGVPSGRARGKAHRNANSTVNPTSPTAAAHAAAAREAAVQSAANIGTDVDHGMANKSPTHASNEFVDFIYDYATKNEEGKDPPAPPPKKLYQDKNDRQTPDVPERRHGRERARAHTHGHAQRKQKHAAQKAANHKSQLISDAGSGLTSALTVPNLAMGNDSDPHSDDSLSQKVAELKNAGRERARAHSHGHRKHKGGDSKQKHNKINNANSKNHVGNTSAQSVPEIAAAIAAENGHGIYSSHTEEVEESHYDTPKRQHAPPDDMPYEAVHVQEINEPIPDNMPELIAEVKKLRNSNAKLRRELIDAKKAVEKDARKIDGMEAELRRLRHREAEDAKTLETMVQHVEANLKRTTERAVTAENTITKLKGEIKSLKSELNQAQGGKKKPEDRKEYKEMKEKAHAASLKLATAAKEAETNIKQLMQGVDVLKLMAETLACIDRVTEDKQSTEKGFGTSL